jgi:adenylyltransferase/sulfurtransferase
MVDIIKSEITPTELKRRLDAGEQIPLIDVREDRELAICKLPNLVHIPMGQLQARIDELNEYKDKEVVVYCRSGGRSHQCAMYMRRMGFKALNLVGGILAWSTEVDPSLAKY